MAGQRLRGVQVSTELLLAKGGVDEVVTIAAKLYAAGRHLDPGEPLPEPLLGVKRTWDQMMEREWANSAAQFTGVLGSARTRVYRHVREHTAIWGQ